MSANIHKNRSQIDNAFSIELKASYRRSACRRSTNEQSESVTPGKVIAPNMSSRMKQRDQDTCKRIRGFRTGIFQVIAPLATERQVRFCMLPTTDAWQICSIENGSGE